MTAMSARWNIGAACIRRPYGVDELALATHPYAEVIMLSWVSVTPLGVPVVPPV